MYDQDVNHVPIACTLPIADREPGTGYMSLDTSFLAQLIYC